MVFQNNLSIQNFIRKNKAYLKSSPFHWNLKAKLVSKKIKKFYKILESVDKSLLNKGKPKDKAILIFTSISLFSDHLLVDLLLSLNLRIKGYKPIIIFAEDSLPISHISDRYSFLFGLNTSLRAFIHKRIFSQCIRVGNLIKKNNLFEFDSFEEGIKIFNIENLEISDCSIQEDVNAGIVRYAASSSNEVLTKLPRDVISNYHKAALISQKAIQGLIKKYSPKMIIAHHGIYVPQGIVQKISKIYEIDFYSWHFGYRKSTLIFSKNETYHKELINSKIDKLDFDLTKDKKERIMSYLFSRRTGRNDWIHFNRSPEKGLEPNNYEKRFVFYSSVDWDAALHFPSSLYKSQFEFVDEIISVFKEFTNFELIIRIHPAEISGFHPAFVSLENYINNKFKSLPENIKIVSASSRKSSYLLSESCSAAIVYNSKIGIELPPFGIPIIVGGDCWARGKGFSTDLNKVGQLKDIIANPEKLKLNEQQICKAIKFAYYFYFERCIDTPELISNGKKFNLSINNEINLIEKKRKIGFSHITDLLIKNEEIINSLSQL